MIKLGPDNIGKIYLGETEITKAYLGSTKVFEVGGGPPPVAYEEVTLTYTAGHSFTLMGVLFSYNAEDNRYDATQNIYPAKIELDLDPNTPLVTSVSYVNLCGGIGAAVTTNEVWYNNNSGGYKNINIRFDGTKTSQSGNTSTAFPSTIGFTSDNKFIQDGVEKMTFSGVLKIAYLNGRPSGNKQGNNITKVRVWSI